MAYRAPSDPSRQWQAITPSDLAANNLPLGCSAIYVGGGGDIALVGADSATPVVFTAVPQGVVLPCGPIRVNATGTTATLLVALY